MEPDELQPPPTHNAFTISRPQNHPPEWVRLGPVTMMKNGHGTGYFTATATSHWGWEFLIIPIGEEPPPITAEPLPKRPHRPSPPASATPSRQSQPLPGEEDDDEPQGLFGGGDEPS